MQKRKNKIAAVCLILGLTVLLRLLQWSIPYKIYFDHDVIAIQSIRLKQFVNIHASSIRRLFVGRREVFNPRGRFPYFDNIENRKMIILSSRSADGGGYDLRVFNRNTQEMKSFPIGTSAIGLMINSGEHRDTARMLDNDHVVVRSGMEPFGMVILNLTNGSARFTNIAYLFPGDTERPNHGW